MSIRLLILSDFHFSSENYRDHFSKISSIVKRVTNRFEEGDRLVILVPGDVANKGQKEEYDLASHFFTNLKECLKVSRAKIINPLLYFVPGNHDCDFSLELTSNTIDFDSDKSVLNAINIRQKNYSNFIIEVSSVTDQINPLLSAAYVENSNTFLNLFMLNTAWMSSKVEHKNLKIPERYIFFPKRVDGHNVHKISILMHHHPNSWLTSDDDYILKYASSLSVNIIISAHEHVAEVERRQTEKRSSLIINSGEFGTKSAEFLYICLDEKTNTFRYNWSTERNDFDEKQETSFDYKEGDNWNRLTESNLEFLDELGMLALHPRIKSIKLNDLFVSPYLSQTISHSKSNSLIINDSSSIETLTSEGKFLIDGSLGSGKTALAKILYRRLIQNGKIPIFVNGQDLYDSCNSNLRIERKINEAVNSQYVQGDKILSNSKKSDLYLIVDDFDIIIRNPKCIDNFISYSEQKYLNQLFIFGSSVELSGNLKLQKYFIDFKRFSIESFGPKLIRSLVSKWYVLGDYESTEQELNVKIDNKANFIKNILKQSNLPSTPSTIITILSTNDSISSSKDSNQYGYYLNLIISNTMKKANIDENSHIETLNILSMLGFKMYIKRRKELDFSEFREIVRSYNEECRLDINAAVLFINLRNANILNSIETIDRRPLSISEDTVISFKFDYLYSFFVAKYISKNLSEDIVRKEIVILIDDIHIETNTRILVNIWYFKYDDLVLRLLLEKVSKLLRNVELFKFENPPQVLKSVLDNKAEILTSLKAIDDAKTDEHRANLIQEEEDLEHNNHDHEVDEYADDNFVDLNTVFNLLSCISQIMRCYGGSVKAKDKTVLIDSCYKLSMGSISIILSLISNEKDIVEYARYLKETEKRPDIHEIYEKTLREISGLIRMSIIGVVLKLSESVSIDKIELSVDDYIKDNANIGTKLMSIASKYLYLNKEKTQQVLDFSETIKNDFFSFDILRVIIWRYYYYNNFKDRIGRDSLFSKLNLKKESILISKS